MSSLNKIILIFVLLFVATQTASADLLTTDKVVRKFGINQKLTVFQRGGPETGYYIDFITPTDSVTQNRQGEVSYEDIHVDVVQGHTSIVRGSRTMETNTVTVQWRIIGKDSNFRVLDIQDKRTEDEKRKFFKSQGLSDKEIDKQLYDGILGGVIPKTEFQPGDIVEIVVDYNQHKDPTYATLVVKPYTLYEKLLAQTARQSPEFAAQLQALGDKNPLARPGLGLVLPSAQADHPVSLPMPRIEVKEEMSEKKDDFPEPLPTSREENKTEPQPTPKVVMRTYKVRLNDGGAVARGEVKPPDVMWYVDEVRSDKKVDWKHPIAQFPVDAEVDPRLHRNCVGIWDGYLVSPGVYVFRLIKGVKS
jgi:hypothetical protein